MQAAPSVDVRQVGCSVGGHRSVLHTSGALLLFGWALKNCLGGRSKGVSKGCTLWQGYLNRALAFACQGSKGGCYGLIRVLLNGEWIDVHLHSRGVDLAETEVT